MSDDVDRANDYAQAERDHSLAMLLRPASAKARTHCIECGEPIGAARLAIVPHAQHCIECATALELKMRHRA